MSRSKETNSKTFNTVEGLMEELGWSVGAPNAIGDNDGADTLGSSMEDADEAMSRVLVDMAKAIKACTKVFQTAEALQDKGPVLSKTVSEPTAHLSVVFT